MKIELYPLEKVVIDGTSIELGMERSAVEGAIGEGEFVGQRHYYYNSEMAIDYDADGKAAFIEFLGGVDGALRPVIYGVSAFEAPAEELAEILAKKNHGEIEDSEQGCSLVFFNISVGLYREVTPSAVLEMIEEMKAEGIPTQDNEDLKADMRRANHWATIGVGAAGYYR